MKMNKGKYIAVLLPATLLSAGVLFGCNAERESGTSVATGQTSAGEGGHCDGRSAI
ncbi:hypothetical protein [Paenibacillus apiarius]|uniref:hypothetical protein n=1 Tax=Paenibacillus apiarius TaxID=46240 RepID=UPI003B3B719D